MGLPPRQLNVRAVLIWYAAALRALKPTRADILQLCLCFFVRTTDTLTRMKVTEQSLAVFVLLPNIYI